MLLQGYYIILIPNTQCNNLSHSLKIVYYELWWQLSKMSLTEKHQGCQKEAGLVGGWAGCWGKGPSQGRYRATEQGEWWALINTRELVTFWCNKHLSEGRREGNGKCCWECLWEGDGHLGKEYWEGIYHCQSIVWKFSVQNCFPLSPRYLRQCGN